MTTLEAEALCMFALALIFLFISGMFIYEWLKQKKDREL